MHHANGICDLIVFYYETKLIQSYSENFFGLIHNYRLALKATTDQDCLMYLQIYIQLFNNPALNSYNKNSNESKYFCDILIFLKTG